MTPDLHHLLLQLCSDADVFPTTQYQRAQCRQLKELGYAEWDLAERVWIPTEQAFAYRRKHGAKADAA